MVACSCPYSSFANHPIVVTFGAGRLKWNLNGFGCDGLCASLALVPAWLRAKHPNRQSVEHGAGSSWWVVVHADTSRLDVSVNAQQARLLDCSSGGLARDSADLAVGSRMSGFVLPGIARPTAGA